MSTVMSAPVMIMAGGTGGHIFPALAVAKVLRARGVPVMPRAPRQTAGAVRPPASPAKCRGP